MKSMKSGLAGVMTVLALAAGAKEQWPFALLRVYGSYEDNQDFLERVFAAQERHPGLFEEFWMAGGETFNSPEDFAEQVGKGNLAIRERCHQLGIDFSYQANSLNHDEDGLDRPGIPEDAWIVGRDGKPAKGFLCYTSPFVKDFVYRRAKCAMEKLRPDAYWPDDDVRAMKLSWSQVGNCFCPRCIELFAKYSGRSWTREALIEALDGKTALSAQVRRQWCEHNGKMLCEFVKSFRRAADEVDPKIRLGIQGSTPFQMQNGTFYRDVIAVLAGENGKTGYRPGGCYYTDFESSYEMLDKILGDCYGAAQAMRDKKIGQICYEAENWPHMGALKNANGMMRECALAIAAGCDSLALYWGADINGESPESYDFWLETFSAWKPFLKAERDAFRDAVHGGLSQYVGEDLFKLTNGWANSFDDTATRLAYTGIPIASPASEPEAYIVSDRTLKTISAADLPRLFSKATLMSVTTCQRLSEKFPELKLQDKLRIVPISSELATATDIRTKGFESFSKYGRCDNLHAFIYPLDKSVKAFSVMTADPQATGTCTVPTAFGGKAVVVQYLPNDAGFSTVNFTWAGCRRHAILDALDDAVKGGMPVRVMNDGYAVATFARKDADGNTIGAFVMNLGSGEAPPMEVALRHGKLGTKWQLLLPRQDPAPASVVSANSTEIVCQIPSLPAYGVAVLSAK